MTPNGTFAIEKVPRRQSINKGTAYLFFPKLILPMGLPGKATKTT
jgi:hypothetical protein